MQYKNFPVQSCGLAAKLLRTVDKVRHFYETRLTENHVLQILGHELAHHSEYFSDEDYETDLWYEEGMAEYISRKELLSKSEFEEKAAVEQLLVELLSSRLSMNHTVSGLLQDYASTFFCYWQGFLAIQKQVAACGGDVVAVLKQGIKQ